MRVTRLLLLLLVSAPAAAAQSTDSSRVDSTRVDSTAADSTKVETSRADTTEKEPRSPWRTSYFPYITCAANDGPALVGRVRYWQPASYEDRVTSTAAFNVDAGITPRGSRGVTAQ
jgi:hypothetical protein